MKPEGFSDHYDMLRAVAREAPQEPGVYIWRDDASRIIYVGKARVLRNRLTSYFAGTKDAKTGALLKHATSIETIIVATEYDALLLENTLIKQYSPKYNINLKDGKTYPVIRITAETFPRVFRTRRLIEDGSLYFGPFPNVHAVDTMLELIEQLLPLRKCQRFRKRESPCMYYHISRCMAPCCNKITEEAYKAHVMRVQQLLSGATESLIMDLTEQMHAAATALRFEDAVRFRDTIRAIEHLSEGNAVVDFDPEGRDYIAWASEGVLTTFTVFSMRGGKMTGRELFRTRSAADEVESLETFAAAYYTPDRPPPPQIYSASLLTSHSSLIQWFTERFGYAPNLLLPHEKRHEAVLAMARQNALEDLRTRVKERGAGPALDELVQALGLRSRPERIEGFDIAQLDGKHPVASLISFKNGVPDRKHYRYFKLRTVVGVVDDFAAMREAVHRRYSRLLKEGKELPDLVLIDGGIGQVNAAKGVLDELGMRCDVLGLAKRDEELWLPHTAEPIRLSRRSEALKVLQFLRDETHRFATSFNQQLRSKDLAFPVLESVEGIGPRRAAALMKTYGSIEKIAVAEINDLMERGRISESTARAVRAAANLALEDQDAAKQRFASGAGRSASGRLTHGGNMALVSPGTALAAEARADYDDSPSPEVLVQH
ncbi:MAG: excinuclease ABC subunit UvrC [Treponema sp.]|jgi:excinuclease ABC subunit C|nr:excinuclease ABC subunit UvrC [Treponema sp.]